MVTSRRRSVDSQKVARILNLIFSTFLDFDLIMNVSFITKAIEFNSKRRIKV